MNFLDQIRSWIQKPQCKKEESKPILKRINDAELPILELKNTEETPKKDPRKLNDQDIAQIKILIANNMPLGQIAAKYSVSYNTISKIRIKFRKNK